MENGKWERREEQRRYKHHPKNKSHYLVGVCVCAREPVHEPMRVCVGACVRVYARGCGRVCGAEIIPSLVFVLFFVFPLKSIDSRDQTQVLMLASMHLIE